MLGVDGDHGDARPRARFGGDGVHIQVTPTVRPRCHGQFPLFCSFPGLQILPGFQIDLVDLNTPRPKTPRFPNSSTKFRLLRKECLKAVTRRINFCGSKKATILKMHPLLSVAILPPNNSAPA